MEKLGQNNNQSLYIRRQTNEIVIPRSSNQPILFNLVKPKQEKIKYSMYDREIY